MIEETAAPYLAVTEFSLLSDNYDKNTERLKREIEETCKSFEFPLRRQSIIKKVLSDHAKKMGTQPSRAAKVVVLSFSDDDGFYMSHEHALMKNELRDILQRDYRARKGARASSSLHSASSCSSQCFKGPAKKITEDIVEWFDNVVYPEHQEPEVCSWHEQWHVCMQRRTIAVLWDASREPPVAYTSQAPVFLSPFSSFIAAENVRRIAAQIGGAQIKKMPQDR